MQAIVELARALSGDYHVFVLSRVCEGTTAACPPA
jgi:hypothetical protein